MALRYATIGRQDSLTDTSISFAWDISVLKNTPAIKRSFANEVRVCLLVDTSGLSEAGYLMLTKKGNLNYAINVTWTSPGRVRCFLDVLRSPLAFNRRVMSRLLKPRTTTAR